MCYSGVMKYLKKLFSQSQCQLIILCYCNSIMNRTKTIWHVSSLVMKGNNVVRGNYNSTQNKMYQIASCSKFITGLVVAKLYELGKLDYNTDVNKYIKQWKCPANGITLRHLLTHTSGSTDHNGYLGADPQLEFKQSLKTNIEIINGDSYSKPFNPTKKPGKHHIYSGSGYQVVQQVVEEITGKRLYYLMDQYLFKPLEMTHSTGKLLYEGKHDYDIIGMDGLYRMYPETAAAGVWMSCDDLFILVKDLMDGYNDDNSRILKQETIKMITKGEYPEWQKTYANYGLGMFVGTKGGKKLIAHNGLNYAYIMHFHCIPEAKEIEIIMINYNPKYHGNVFKESMRLIKQKGGSDNKHGAYADDNNIYSVDLMFMYIKDKKPKAMLKPLTDLIGKLNESDWGDGLTAMTVIENKDKYPEHYNRIMKADLSYPIIIDKHDAIIDGMHRLAKAFLLKKKTIGVYTFDDSLMKKFIVSKKAGKEWTESDWNYFESLTIDDLKKMYRDLSLD